MAYANQTRTSSISLSDRVMSVVEGLKAGFARRRVYNQTLSELATLNDRELADLGLHRASICEVARKAAYGK